MSFATPPDHDFHHDLACLYRRIGRTIGHCGRSFVEDVRESARDYYWETSAILNLAEMSPASRAKAREYAALNGYRSVMRKRKREATFDPSEVESYMLVSDDPASSAERRETISRFRRCICAATSAAGHIDAKAFWLSWRKEKTYQQISRKLGVSPQRVGRSVRKLRAGIGLLWQQQNDG